MEIYISDSIINSVRGLDGRLENHLAEKFYFVTLIPTNRTLSLAEISVPEILIIEATKAVGLVSFSAVFIVSSVHLAFFGMNPNDASSQTSYNNYC